MVAATAVEWRGKRSWNGQRLWHTSEMSASVASHRAEMELMLLTRCAKKAEENTDGIE